MGISDRDYVRHERRSTNPIGDWDVITWLICINVAVYVTQFFSGITEWFRLDPQKVIHGQIWRLTTYDFLHSQGSVWHIVMNMYILFMTGRRLLGQYTSREFLLFYLSAGVLSGIGFVIWQLALRQNVPAIGASGAVAAVMVLYAMHWPRDVWMIFGIIPVPVMVLVILMLVLDLHPILMELGMGAPSDGVAHIAHLGGMAFAFLYDRLNWRLEGLADSLNPQRLRRIFRPRPKLKVHRPSDPAIPIDPRDLQTKVDELLEKIHLEGEQSLTEADREVLNTASRILRKRRGH